MSYEGFSAYVREQRKKKEEKKQAEQRAALQTLQTEKTKETQETASRGEKTASFAPGASEKYAEYNDFQAYMRRQLGKKAQQKDLPVTEEEKKRKESGERFWRDADAGYASWLENFDAFQEKFRGDYLGRQGKYQSPETLGEYRQGLDPEMKDLAAAVNTYQNYYRKNKNLYDSLYGEGTTEAILSRLKEGDLYLSRARTALDDEYNVWSQFDSEEEYTSALENQREYERLASLDIEETRRQIEALQQRLDRTEPKAIEGNLGYGRVPNAKEISEASGMEEGERISTEIEQLERDVRRAESIQAPLRYGKYREAPDFAEYAERGAAIENPSYREAEGSFRIGPWRFNEPEIGNIVTYSRENADELYLSSANHAHPRGDFRYKYLTEEEAEIYNYLLMKEGKEKAQEYLDVMGETMDARAGAEIAENVDKMDNGFLKALEIGSTAAVTGLQNSVGIDSGITQYAGAYMYEDLKDAGPKIFGKSLGQMGYDAVRTTANMVPSIAVSTLSAGLGAPAAAAGGLGSLTMGASSGYLNYKQMLREGYSEEQARNYGILTGASEGGLQYVLGGVSSLGGKVTGNLGKRAIQNIDNAFLRIAADLGVHMAGEGAEEYLQDILDPAIRNLVLGENNEIRLFSEDAAYSFLLGSLTAGLLEGGHTTASDLNQGKIGEAVLSLNRSEELIENALQMRENPEIYELAEDIKKGKIPESRQNIGELFALYAEAGGDVSFFTEQAPDRGILEGETQNVLEETDQEAAEYRTEEFYESAESAEPAESIQEEGREAVPQSPEPFFENTGKERLAKDSISRAAETLGKAGGAALKSFYDNETAPGEYYGGFAAFYEAGIAGRELSQVKSPYGAYLNEAQKKAAYLAGQRDGEVSLQEERNRTLVYSREAGFSQEGFEREIPKETAAALDMIGKALGTRIQGAPATGEGGANGWISKGSIYIAADAENPLYTVAKHEITHRIQETAPEAYRAYRNYAANAWAEGGDLSSLIEEYKRRYRAAGQNLTTERALDEIAADFTENLLQNPKEFQALAAGRPSMAKRLVSVLQNFIRKIKNAFQGDKGAQNRATLETYGFSLETLEKAEALWKEAFLAAKEKSSGQIGEQNGILNNKSINTNTDRNYSLKEDAENGGEDNQGGRRTAEISSEEGEGRDADGGRRGGTGEIIRQMVRALRDTDRGFPGLTSDPSFGQKAKVKWAAEGVIKPKKGSLAYYSQQIAAAYGVPSFVIRDDVYDQNEKAAAFTAGGQIYFKETLPEDHEAVIALHELTHAMKQRGFQPYLDFLEKTPELIDMSNKETMNILARIEKYYGLDILEGTELEKRKLYDELNAVLYGIYKSGAEEHIEYIRPIAQDFDSYMRELDKLHEQFREERTEEKRYSLKEENRNGGEINQGRTREEEIPSEEGSGRNADKRGRRRAREIIQEICGQSFADRGSFSLNSDPAFGEKPKFKPTAEGVIRPKKGSLAYYSQQIVAAYGVPSFVIRDEVIKKNDLPLAFTIKGQIYFAETLPEDHEAVIALHELVHAMHDLNFQPYLDFLERTPELIDMSNKEAMNLLGRIEAHYKKDFIGKEISEEGKNLLYDEFNSVLYGIYKSGIEEEIEDIRLYVQDFDSYMRELDKLHEQFREERTGERRYSLKEDAENGGEIDRRRVGQKVVSSEEGTRRDADKRGRRRAREIIQEICEQPFADRGRSGLTSDPSFGQQAKVKWAAEGIVRPKKGSLAYYSQQIAAAYGVPSFVIRDDVYGQNKKAAAFTAGGQIYFKETLPENHEAVIALHELTHAMRQRGFQPYLDFLEKTPELIDMGSKDAVNILARIEEYYGLDILEGTELEKRKLYDELNAVLYGIYKSGVEKYIESIRPIAQDFDAYMRELDKLHEQFREERTEERRFSIKRSFRSDIQEWNEEGRPGGERFTLGSTGSVLQGLGAIESDIYMNSDKINAILENHPEMTLNEIKRIPDVLEDPVLVLKSRNIVRSQYGNSRLVLFGAIKAVDGRPIMCVMDLRPVENGFLLDDMQKVSSAYTKDNKPTEFIARSEILYADKKRTIPLLRGIGFQTPMSLLQNGSIGTISYNGKSVNLSGAEFSSIVELKDLTKIENITQDISSSYGDKPLATFLRDVSMDSIPSGGGDVNVKFSLKGKGFTEDKYFARQIDHWDALADNSRIKVGEARQGSALERVGLPAAGMYFDVGKIKKAMKTHSDHLTAEILKGIPDLLNDPIVITEYTGPNGTVKNTVNVYGNLFAGNTPVVVGVVMRLDLNGRSVINNIRTIHARSNFAKQITDGSVLYLNEDKKKTRSWFHVCGNLNVPLDGTKYGLIRSIAFDGGDVNLSGAEFSSVVELDGLHKQFREERTEERRYSLKEENRNGREINQGRARENAIPSEEEAGRGADGRGRGRAREIAREMVRALHDADRGRSGLTSDPSFGQKAKVKWAEDGVINPKKGSLAYYSQQIAAAYGVPSFVIRDDVYGQNKKAAAFTAGGQIYFKETLPENHEAVIALHELTHAMKQMNFQPYLDFLERTSDEINMSDPAAIWALSKIEEYYGLDILEGTELEKRKLYDELNAVLYGIYKSGIEEEIEDIRSIAQDFDSYMRKLDKLHEQFREERTEEKRYSLKSTSSLQRDVARLEAANRNLREQVEYWKGQTKRSQGPRTDKRAVERTARELLREYGSEGSLEETAAGLQGLYDYIARNGDGKNDLTFEEARSRAEAIAESLLGESLARDNENYENYRELREYLKNTELRISQEDAGDIEEYGRFRKENFGRLKLKKGEGNIDSVYGELSEKWPEFFDGERETHPADQLRRISEVLEEIYSAYEYNPYEGDMKTAIDMAGADILERFFDLPQAKATFADKQTKALSKMKWEERRKTRELREKKNGEISRIREENRKRVKETLAKERALRDKKIQDIKERYREKDVAGRERQKARELRARITRHAGTLSKKLLRPSDANHVPEGLRQSAASLLQAINLESLYTIDQKTGKRVKNGEGTPLKRTEAFRQLRQAYEALSKEGGDSSLVIDPDLLPNLREAEAMSHIPIDGMDVSQLRVLWQAVKAMEASISTADKMFGKVRFERISQAAEGIRKDAAEQAPRRNWRGPGGKAGDLLHMDMLTPQSYFHRLGKTGDSIFRMLRNAQDRHISIMEEAQKATEKILGEKMKVRELEKKTRKFNIEGETFELTTAQVMSLYKLLGRKAAQEHLLKGGFRPEGTRKGIREKGRPEPIRLSMEGYRRITETLTPEEKRIADGLQRYMGKELARLGNQASMEVYGYEKFGDPDYFPIKTDKNQVSRDVGKEAMSATIAGRGFTKQTNPGASNALMVGSFFDVYAEHVNDMATYGAWLAPMENLKRIQNFTFWDKEGRRTGTVKGSIERVFGKRGNHYLTTLTDHLNQGVKTDRTELFSMESFSGNYKAAAIGANLRVIVQQPTAYFRAWLYLNPLRAGDPFGRYGGYKTAKKYAPIAVWKDWGYFDINTGRQMKDVLLNADSPMDKVKNALMKPAGFMDSITWGRIWDAAGSVIHRENPGLDVHSDAFYEKVAEKFNEVIDRTQVVDGILQRSQIMRSGNGLTKMATSFMAEPTKTYNMFTNALYDWRRASKGERGKALKKVGRTALALLASFAANAAMQSFVDALRDNDKEKSYWEKWISAFWGPTGEETSYEEWYAALGHGNFLSNFDPLLYLPYGKDIVSLTQGYSVDRMDMETISRFITAAGTMMKAMSGEGKYTREYAWLQLAAEASRLFGLPAGNLKRDMESILNTAAAESNNYLLQYRILKFFKNISYSSNQADFADILYKAMENDREAYAIIYEDMKQSGADMEKIGKALEKKIKDAAGVASVKDLDERYISPDKEEEYRGYITALEESALWKEADKEEKGRAKTMAYEMAGDSKKGRELLKKAEEAGVDGETYALYRLALELADKDDNGSYTQEETEEAIRMLQGLSQEKRANLWQTSNIGWKAENNPFR